MPTFIFIAFLAGWCGNEPRRIRIRFKKPPLPDPPDPPWWQTLSIDVLAGIAGVGGGIVVANALGGAITEPLTFLAGMAGAFVAGRAISSVANGFLGGSTLDTGQIG